jgi:threonine dehydrogenase-like Zn-dependent dehydrogenase
MKSNFRTAVLAAPGRVTLQERELLPLTPGQIRVRLSGCGVCGSNLPVWEGRPWFNYPLEGGQPGHEGWGVVDAVAPDVTTLQPGQRVAALSYHAFADFDVCAADRVVSLPEAIGEQPFPGEALGCAMNVFRRCEIQPHHHVAVIGLGFLGALLVQLAVKTGARVYAISRRDCALRMAEEFGATAAIKMDDHSRILREMKNLTDGNGCDRVIEVTGHQWPLQLAAELAAVRARLIIAGYHQDGLRHVDMQLWNWRGLDVINAHERDPDVYLEGMRRAAAAVAAGDLNPRPLYTHAFPLEDLGDAFNHLRDRSENFFKAFVVHG